ncbi:class I SAM-dependent methyltransferase [Sphingomicrobium arenosum]|uniref:class I SAM-dependent methyltransferase n=1 Tax=Sphingomicrobium arenosum TaxID=2233861 RepID=UPI002240529E|nr:class I SAM-dependent methyltransferase [Sphingomicrobium arenosum]
MPIRQPASLLRRIIALVPGLQPLLRSLRHRLDPRARELHRLRTEGHPDLLQPSPDSWDERYPELFDALAQMLAEHPAPRILSFGCSTGEEVRAMRRRLPHARIIGVDINAGNIDRARKSDPEGDYRVASRPPEGERFDAILALAIFRHARLKAEEPLESGDILPPERVRRLFALLDSALVPGGHLALWNHHFPLQALAREPGRWRAHPLRLDPPMSLLYGADGIRIDEREDRALFQKRD